MGKIDCEGNTKARWKDHKRKSGRHTRLDMVHPWFRFAKGTPYAASQIFIMSAFFKSSAARGLCCASCKKQEVVSCALSGRWWVFLPAETGGGGLCLIWEVVGVSTCRNRRWWAVPYLGGGGCFYLQKKEVVGCALSASRKSSSHVAYK